MGSGVKLEITLKNGQSCTWDASKGEYDRFSYDGGAIVIKSCGEIVGIYNMDSVICAVVKQE